MLQTLRVSVVAVEQREVEMFEYTLASKDLEAATGDQFEGSLELVFGSLVAEAWRKTPPDCGGGDGVIVILSVRLLCSPLCSLSLSSS